MSKLRLGDLKDQGFEVTKEDAQELHHKMNEISQRGDEGYNEVYAVCEAYNAIKEPPIDPDASGDDPNELTKEQLSLKIIDLQSDSVALRDQLTDKEQENADQATFIELLKERAEESKIYIGDLEARIDELQKGNNEDIDPAENTQGADNSGDQEQGNSSNDGSQPGPFMFSLPIKGEHHLTRKKRLADAGLKEQTVSQEDIDNIPELKLAGLKPGDIIEIPA